MRRLPAAVLVTSLSLVLAACGGGSSGGNSSGSAAKNTPTASAAAPADTATATADIKHVYATFFSSPIPKAKTLLEDGPALSKAFKIANKLKGNSKEGAKVKSVTFTSPTTASVKYVLLLAGTPLNPKGSDGQAILVNGQWKVAKATFCGLVGLGYSKPIPNC